MCWTTPRSKISLGRNPETTVILFGRLLRDEQASVDVVSLSTHLNTGTSQVKHTVVDVRQEDSSGYIDDV